MKCKGYIWTIVLTLYVSLAWAQAVQDTVCMLQPPSNLRVPYQPNLVYQWNVGGGSIISKPDSNAIKVDWSTASPGMLNVSVTCYNRLTGCPGDTSYTSLLITRPLSANTPPPAEVCAGEWTVLESIRATGFQWQDGSSDRFFKLKPKADTSVYLVAFNGKCENDTIYYKVNVLGRPRAGISPLPDTVILNSTVQASYNRLGTANTEIEWFLNGYSQGFGRAVNFHFTQGGWNDIAQLVNEGACYDTLWKEVYVNDQYTAHFPNAFTPNGDGINDYWTFDGVGHQSFVAEIYNRWGELLFSWTEQDEIPGWSGFSFGEEAKQGTYVYVVTITDLHGKMRTYRNHLTLIR